MRLPGQCWLLLWLPPLAWLLAGAAREEEAALSVPRCKALKEMDLIKTSESDCYCYNHNTQMEWTYMWSTMQVKITSPGLLSIEYITENHNCQYPETILSFIKCVINNFWVPEESNEITIVISPYGETVCFSVKPVRKIFIYTMSVNRNIVDFRLFLVFMIGIFLFFYAEVLSQSPVFYYFLGTVLGVLMTLVFVLLMVKRYIPKEQKSSDMGSVVPVPGSDLCWGGHASVCLCSYDTPHVFPESELPIESIQLYEVLF
uniref:Nuclear envelope integral membrane protein 2 n=1 Tax=Castor canadensis TaxID=51338 RepID=A0A8C0WFS8_CASCN